MTPFDVVKIRLQSQAKPSNFTKGHCFVYCNGLMDHLCPCVNGLTPSSEWYKRPSHFTGTFVSVKMFRNYLLDYYGSVDEQKIAIQKVPDCVCCLYEASMKHLALGLLGLVWESKVNGADNIVCLYPEVIDG